MAFQSKPGVYLENLGNAHLQVSNWNLLIYYDLNIYLAELQGLEQCMNKINRLCKDVARMDPTTTSCKILSQQFGIHLAEIQETNGMLFHQKQRSKRGIINGVGTLFHYAFGLLDDEVANHYNDQIDSLKTNEQYLLTLIKNQTSVVDATAQIFQQNIEGLKTQFQQLEDHIQLIDITSNWDRQKNGLTQKLNTISSYSILMLMRFRHTQSILLSMLTSIQPGTIHPTILKPQTLIEQISIIQNNLPKQLTLPLTSHTVDVLTVMKTSSLKTKIVKDKIIIEMRIPVTSSEDYQVFKLIPVPTKIQDKYMF